MDRDATLDGKEPLDGSHVVEAFPSSPPLAFKVIFKAPPPPSLVMGPTATPLAPIASVFPPGSQLSAPLAPNVAETVDHVGEILGPNGHKVSVPPPCAPSLATDRLDCREGRNMNKKGAKLKKRKDRK